MSFSDNPARWLRIFLALVLCVSVYGLSYLLDSVGEKLEARKAAEYATQHAPVPTTIQVLSLEAWQTGARFQKPESEEEAFALGPFERANVGMAPEGAAMLPGKSEKPAVAGLMHAGTQALLSFDEAQAVRCFRTVVVEDAECAGGWLGLAVASEKLPGRAAYFLDRAEAAKGKGGLEEAWGAAYRAFFATAEREELAVRLSRLAVALDGVAAAHEGDSLARLLAMRHRILSHHLTGAVVSDPMAMDAALAALGAKVGGQAVAIQRTLLWLHMDARKSLEHARGIQDRSAVLLRLAAAPSAALGDWSRAKDLLSGSLANEAPTAEDEENGRRLVWALYHEGRRVSALGLAKELARQPRTPRMSEGSIPDVDAGDSYVEGRRLRAQMLMAAGEWQELARADSLTTLEEGGCTFSMAQTRYWRTIAYAAQGFDRNAKNQLQELQEMVEETGGRLETARHLAEMERLARGADSFLELTRGHVNANLSEIVDVPPTVLAPFLAKAGQKAQAVQLLEAALKANPASLPLRSMLKVAKTEEPLKAEFITEDPASPSPYRLPLPLLAPGFTLNDETGSVVGMEKWKGQPLLLFFVAGGGKVEDAKPLEHLRTQAPSFGRFGIPMVVISTEEASRLQEALGMKGTPSQDLPFTMLSDPQLNEFKAWGCFDDFLHKPVHGAFLIDPQGSILWRRISHQSCVHPEYLLMECQRLLALWETEEAAPPAAPNSLEGTAKPVEGAAASPR